MTYHSIHYSQPFALGTLSFTIISSGNSSSRILLQDWSVFVGKPTRGRLVEQTTAPGTISALKVAIDTHCLPALQSIFISLTLGAVVYVSYLVGLWLPCPSQAAPFTIKIGQRITHSITRASKHRVQGCWGRKCKYYNWSL